MPYREIPDDGGAWVVFGTRPHSGANVRPRYAEGWLSFQRGVERRRLAPIPDDWENASDIQLRVWLLDAELVTKASEDQDAQTGSVTAGAGDSDTAAAEQPLPAPEPAAAPAVEPPTRMEKSVERIRAMLREIRSDRD
jgi:hypothetical protein